MRLGRTDRSCHFIASWLYQQRNALCHAIFVVIQGGMTAALVQTNSSDTAHGRGRGARGAARRNAARSKQGMADNLPLERFQIRISRAREPRPQHPFCISQWQSRSTRCLQHDLAGQSHRFYPKSGSTARVSTTHVAARDLCCWVLFGSSQSGHRSDVGKQGNTISAEAADIEPVSR